MRSLTHSDRNAVLLLGRLGNQLFQYSFARWLEAQTGLPTYFDLSMTRRYGIGGPERFRSAVTERAIRGSRRFPAPGGRLGPVGHYLRRALGPERVVVDMTGSGPADLDPGLASWWVGYWQQLQFAEVARAELRSLIGIDGTPQRTSRKRIAVHVRRGDYVGLGLALPPSWYKAATDEALELTGDAEIWVFSDDPRWCEETLQLSAPFSMARLGSPLDDFRSLAQADAMVTSASTYSWWAGFLGAGRVICPEGPLTLPTPPVWHPVPLVRPTREDSE